MSRIGEESQKVTQFAVNHPDGFKHIEFRDPAFNPRSPLSIPPLGSEPEFVLNICSPPPDCNCVLQSNHLPPHSTPIFMLAGVLSVHRVSKYVPYNVCTSIWGGHGTFFPAASMCLYTVCKAEKNERRGESSKNQHCGCANTARNAGIQAWEVAGGAPVQITDKGVQRGNAPLAEVWRQRLHPIQAQPPLDLCVFRPHLP